MLRTVAGDDTIGLLLFMSITFHGRTIAQLPDLGLLHQLAAPNGSSHANCRDYKQHLEDIRSDISVEGCG